MALDPKQFSEIVDRLTNALQTAVLLASRLEPDTRQTARDAAQLHETVTKAAAAIRELRPAADEGGAL